MRVLSSVTLLTICIAQLLHAQIDVALHAGAATNLTTGSVEVGAFVAMRSTARVGLRLEVAYPTSLDLLWVGACLTATPSPRAPLQAYSVLGLGAVIPNGGVVSGSGAAHTAFSAGLGLRWLLASPIFGFAELRSFWTTGRDDIEMLLFSARAGVQVRL